MSLTTATYRERVFYRISGGVPEATIGVYRPAIEATMNDAIYQLCFDSLTEPWRASLESDFTLSLANGVADFSGSTTLLPSSILACQKITHPSIVGPGTATLPLHIKATREAVNVAAASTASIFGYAYVGKNSIEAMYQGAYLAGTLTVRGVLLPTITAGTSTVPFVLESRLIDRGAALAIQKVTSQAQSA